MYSSSEPLQQCQQGDLSEQERAVQQVTGKLFGINPSTIEVIGEDLLPMASQEAKTDKVNLMASIRKSFSAKVKTSLRRKSFPIIR